MKLKLFCLHFGGGNKFSLQEIAKYIENRIETVFLEIPGRGRRIDEELLSDLNEMAQDVYAQLKKQIQRDTKYILYGHSLGGMLVFLVSRLLQKNGDIMPIHLIPSGVKAPIHRRAKNDYYHVLSDREFEQRVYQLGGIPDAVMAHREILDFFLPALRADFKAIETYVYSSEEPLKIPITALAGLQEGISMNELKDWQMESQFPLTIKQYEGNHFFIFENYKEVAGLINSKFPI